MKIALNMSTLRGFGSGRVGRHIFYELAYIAPEHQFYAWIPDTDAWRAQAAVVPTQSCQVESGIKSKFLTENWHIRREVSAGKYDALFSLGDTSLPWCPSPHLLMVQQAYLAYMPEELGFELPSSFRAKLLLMEQYFRLGKSSVTRFTVQSESMKCHLSRRWDISMSRIDVVPSYIDVSISSALRNPVDPPYICYVASPSPHKNFEILAFIMAELAKDWLELTCKITVEPQEVPALREHAQRLGVLERFEFLGRIENVGELLSGARVFVMPSQLESFGLPYYEAMAAGCPVVAADYDFAREACGDAALYASAPEGYAEQIRRLLSDDALAQQYTNAGHTRIKQQNWSWKAAAQRYLSILENLEQ